jgi:uncharacterized protein YjiK
MLYGCRNNPSKPYARTGYDVNSPDETIVLPGILHEISGLTRIDDNNFACIQDEKGIIFFYNLSAKGITRQIPFSKKGDYEGIARAGDTLFVLESDGILYEVDNFDTDSIVVMPFTSGVDSKNSEGLCFDRKNDRLLIAPKENPLKGPGSKNKREIYGFSLRSMKLEDEPVFMFDIDSLKDYAEYNGVDLHVKGKKQKSSSKTIIKFRPSAIGIHPLTGDIYILSSEDFMLFIFTKNGGIKHVVKLNPLKFPQAEGITFLENGDMLISNEGQSKSPASLQVLKYHPDWLK